MAHRCHSKMMYALAQGGCSLISLSFGVSDRIYCNYESIVKSLLFIFLSPSHLQSSDIQQKQCDIGQAANAPAGTLASYETVASDDGVGNDAGKYTKL